MCLLCVELAKENMNYREIAQAYREMQTDMAEDPHYWELISEIINHSDLNEVMKECNKMDWENENT